MKGSLFDRSGTAYNSVYCVIRLNDKETAPKSISLRSKSHSPTAYPLAFLSTTFSGFRSEWNMSSEIIVPNIFINESII